MTKRYKIHEESKLGISFAEGRLLTWGDSLVKAWPKGLDEECEELDCFGEVRAAVSTRHSDKTYGKLVFLHWTVQSAVQTWTYKKDVTFGSESD